MSKETETLAQVIEAARKRKGISQRELSRQTGIDNNTIAQIEKGNRKKPNALSLKKLANVLGLDLRDVMMLAGYSLEDIEATIDPIEEEFKQNERMTRSLFAQYFKDNDITKTEWFKSQDKAVQRALKEEIKRMNKK